MDAQEEERIADIVTHALEHDHEVQAKKEDVARSRRHLIRRCTSVSVLVVVVILTHHYTNIEPVGKLGEVGVGALLSWFFEKAGRGEV